jgi:hypothetical protein
VERLIDFVVYNQLNIMNTWFEHKDTYKFTWNARGQRSVIDYIIVNQKLREIILDCRVFRGFEIKSDRFMFVAPARIQPRWYKEQKITKE